MNNYIGYDPTLYLEHYGVKGMRWGIRRSQEQLDVAAGRYKKKEAAKLQKKYAKKITQYTKKVKSEESKGRTDSEKYLKNLRKSQEASQKWLIEAGVLGNYTTSDVFKEKRAVGKTVARTIIFDIAAVPASMMGVPSYLEIPSISDIKYNYRLSRLRDQ